MLLSIIIPVRHEEDAIATTLEQIAKNVRTPHRVLVVDDSIDPTDKTISVVNHWRSKHKENIQVIPKGDSDLDGFAYALQRGVVGARSGAVVFVMADGCDDVTIIDRMYTLLQKRYDVICASRYMKGGRKLGGPRIQGLFSTALNRFLHLVTGIPTSDITNSFKMYRWDVVSHLNQVLGRGVEASMVMVLEAYFRGAQITQIPTVWRGRTQGTSKFHARERTPRYLRICLWAIERSLALRFFPRTNTKNFR